MIAMTSTPRSSPSASPPVRPQSLPACSPDGETAVDPLSALATAPAARLRPPPAAPFQVARSALCEALCAPGGVRVALVRAPAGFGKSTLMRQALALLEE